MSHQYLLVRLVVLLSCSSYFMSEVTRASPLEPARYVPIETARLRCLDENSLLQGTELLSCIKEKRQGIWIPARKPAKAKNSKI